MSPFPNDYRFHGGSYNRTRQGCKARKKKRGFFLSISSEEMRILPNLVGAKKSEGEIPEPPLSPANRASFLKLGILPHTLPPRQREQGWIDESESNKP